MSCSKVSRNALKGYGFQGTIYSYFLCLMDLKREIIEIDAEVDIDNNFDDIYVKTNSLSYYFQVKNYSKVNFNDIVFNKKTIIVNGNSINVGNVKKFDCNVLLIKDLVIPKEKINGSLFGIDCYNINGYSISSYSQEEINVNINEMYMNERRLLEIIQMADKAINNGNFNIKIEELPQLYLFNQRLQEKQKFISFINKISESKLIVMTRPLKTEISLEKIELNNWSFDESNDYLKYLGIDNYDICHNIFKICKGYPIITYYLAQHYLDNKILPNIKEVDSIIEFYDSLIGEKLPELSVFLINDSYFKMSELKELLGDREYKIIEKDREIESIYENADKSKNYFNILSKEIDIDKYLRENITKGNEYQNKDVLIYLLSYLYINKIKYNGYEEIVESLINNDEVKASEICIKLFHKYNIRTFFIKSFLKHLKDYLFSLGVDVYDNYYKYKSLKDVIISSSKLGSFYVNDFVCNYIKLANYENRMIDIESLCLFYFMYYNRKDYSMYSLPQAMEIFIRKGFITYKDATKIIGNAMDMSEKGIRTIMTDFYNIVPIEKFACLNDQYEKEVYQKKRKVTFSSFFIVI